jgi:hypothetical protein
MIQISLQDLVHCFMPARPLNLDTIHPSFCGQYRMISICRNHSETVGSSSVYLFGRLGVSEFSKKCVHFFPLRSVNSMGAVTFR